MTANTKQNKTIYLILSILSWILVFAIIFARDILMGISGFIILILVDIRLVTLSKKIRSKDNRHNKK